MLCFERPGDRFGWPSPSCAPTPDAGVQRGDHRRQRLAARAREQDVVELVLDRQDLLRRTVPVGRHRPVERILERNDVFGLGVGDEHAGRQPLQHRSDQIEIFRLGASQLPDDRSLVGNRLDDRFRSRAACSASRITVRDTPVMSISSRSIRRAPGARRPSMIALRKASTTSRRRGAARFLTTGRPMLAVANAGVDFPS